MQDQQLQRPVYVIRGERVKSLEDFYREIGEAINGPGGYFGTNLDALWDCLRGGFGTPEEGGYALRWLNAETSRQALGFDETIRQLERRLEHSHSSSHADIQARLARAKRHEGPTVFDWVIDLLRDAEEFGVNVELR
jgi:RNAse (barnase) inhibitor barstar